MRRETTGYPCVEKSLWSRSFMEHCCLSRLYMIRYFCLVIQLRINIHELFSTIQWRTYAALNTTT